MSDLYLMERNGEKMNVPAAKKDAFEKDGWKVLKTPDQNKNVVVQQPVDESVAVETPEKPSEKKGQTVEEAFAKIEKRARSKKGK